MLLSSMQLRCAVVANGAVAARICMLYCSPVSGGSSAPLASAGKWSTLKAKDSPLMVILWHSSRIPSGAQLIAGVFAISYLSSCITKQGPCVVQLWELSWARDKSFTGYTRAMELKGHTSGITCVAFNSAATRAATSSKDGTLRVWKLDVRCPPRLQR